ncbi:ComF family protein [Peribacillus deserti]|uniref:Amidophosphoribosyltransferase n=1 Tax=Peribacillus deserti TaxID=673318 RepID=A0A2N5M9R1_9BACI|nr:ComF family protein [Peribacillus deserti]PLT31063.1 amidophosphoribosyltransferase [Peribacillus deserti]
MKYCLYCGNQLENNITWVSILGRESKDPSFCEECTAGLEKISGERCKVCSRSLDRLDESFIIEDLCLDCHRWEREPEWQRVLNKNLSLYTYNDFLKDLIARFKYRGDYILIKGFKKMLFEVSKQLTFDIAVPIPLSSERLLERGFNQSEAGLITIGLDPVHALTRIHSEKQSKKTRHERIQHEQVFSIVSGMDIQGKRVLILDDIYTTGSTLRHAAKMLKEAGAEEVSSITLARG